MKINGGFTLIELMIVIGIMMILGVVVSLKLVGRNSVTDLTLTTQRMGSLLREAQSRSASGASSTSWGVHFDNVVSSTAYFSLFYGATYSTSTEIGHYRLPFTIRYLTSTIPEGSSSTITFAQLTGVPLTTTTISMDLLPGSIATTTITINEFGVISY